MLSVSLQFRPYIAVVSARFRMLLQYRAAAIAGLVTQIFWGLVRIMILDAFYRSSTSASQQPMTLHEVAGYVWLGQAFLAMLPWNVDGQIREMVRNGSIAYELTRPTDLYTLWFARALALRTAPTLLRSIPIFAFSMLILPLIRLVEWQLSPPPSIAAALCWIACMIGAITLSCAITTLLNISLLWTISGEGISVLVTALVILLTGMVIPLPLFPDWSQPLLRSLPFAGIVDLPFRVYTGNIHVRDAGWVLMHQAIWSIGLIAFGRWLLSRGMRRVVIQGG
jgi:ABC-2 type transport system permease protein